MNEPKKDEDWREIFSSLATIGTIGWVMAVALIIGVGGGIWLDKKFGTSPIFLIVGLVWGLAGGAWYTYHHLSRFFERKDKK